MNHLDNLATAIFNLGHEYLVLMTTHWHGIMVLLAGIMSRRFRMSVVSCVRALLCFAGAEAYAIETLNDPEMILIPAGRFIMGTDDDQRSVLVNAYGIHSDLLGIQPPREVDLPDFHIDKHEVTNDQYRRFVAATGHRLPIRWHEHGYPEALSDCPIIGIDYEDAQAYAAWVGKRLPTEEEWEKAARGDDGRLWAWGNAWDPEACRHDDSGPLPMDVTPDPVGSHPKDRSVYGVMDMAGNVAEWVDAKLKPKFDYMAVTRGGSLAYAEPWQFICATRNAQPKGNGAIGYIGFRCASDALPSREPEAPEVDDRLSIDESPVASPLGPIAARYRSGPVKIHPVYDHDPGLGRYQNTIACCYLPDPSTSEDAEQRPVPWKLELRAPYLPDDRFTLFFENHWQMPMDSMAFNEQHGEATLAATHPDRMRVEIRVVGGPDFVDLFYDVENIGQAELPSSVEMCLSILGAPNFRDHDGARTYILTDQGFKRRAELPQQVLQRLWCQDFTIDEVSRTSVIAPFAQRDLITTLSGDGRWLVAPVSLSGKPIRMFNNWEYSCLHAIPYSRLLPGERRFLRQRVYLLQGSFNTLVNRYERDYLRAMLESP